MSRETAGRSLSRVAVRATAWIGGLRGGIRALALARTIIIARVLPPEEFGVFGIALIMTGALSAVSQLGTSEALVQRRGNPIDYLNSAWSLKVVRGFINWAVLWIFAPTIAGFFGTPEAAVAIRVISLSFVFGALGNQGIVFFIKDLDMKRQFIYEGSGSIVDFAVSVTLAIWLRSGVALAYGYTAGIGALFVASYLLHFHRPRFSLERKKAAELMRYGRWIWLDNILVLLLSEGVGSIVGRLLGSAALGFYQMAQRLANVMTSEAATVLGNVAFPLYAKLQDDLPRLKTAYSSVVKLLTLLVAPLAVLGGVYAEGITRMLLGPLWNGIGPLFAVMLAAGGFLAWSLVNHSLLRAIGRPEVGVKIRLLRFALVALMLLLGGYRSVLSVGLVVVMGLAVAAPFEFAAVFRALHVSRQEAARWLGIPMITALLAVVIARAGVPPADGEPELWPEMLSLTLAACGYLLGIWMWNRYGRYGVGELLSRSIRAGFGKDVESSEEIMESPKP